MEGSVPGMNIAYSGGLYYTTFLFFWRLRILMKRKIAVIAFGGNAILPKEQKGLQKEQMQKHK